MVVMIHNKDLPVHFSGNAMNTICYTTNKICVKLTRYLMSCGKEKKSMIRFLCVFRGKCCTCILRLCLRVHKGIEWNGMKWNWMEWS